MRQPRPYYKDSHKAWYANLGPNRRPVRLASQAEGEEAAWDEYHRLMAGRQPVKYDCRVIDLVQRFIDHHAANSSPNTQQFYFRSLDSFIRFIGPRLRLCDLKPYHVTDWLTRCHRTCKRAKKVGDAWVPYDTGRPTSDGYKHNLVRAVKAAFRWAEEQEYIERSPLHRVKLPPARPRDVYLTPDQWEKLVTAVKDKPLLDVIVVMKETGCRPQEVRRVEARHFDRAGKCWVFPPDESKGKTESRVVLLTDRASEICQRLALKYPEGPLFRNRNGAPWKRRILGYRCYRLGAKLGFHVCPYAIRHTFATDAIIRGVDLQTIATLMGHVDLKMLSRIYQHIRKRSDHLRQSLRKAVGEVA